MKRLAPFLLLLAACTKEAPVAVKVPCNEIVYDYGLNGCYKCLEIKRIYKNNVPIQDTILKETIHCDNSWKSKREKTTASGIYYVGNDYYSDVTYTHCFSQPKAKEECTITFVDPKKDTLCNCLEFITVEANGLIADSTIELGTFISTLSLNHKGVSYWKDTLGQKSRILKRTICF